MSVIATVLTHRELIENLVVRDIKARYKQSVIGITWTILHPMVTALIFSFVGVYILRQNTLIPFPIYCYFGILFWTTFSAGISNATESLVSHLSLISKLNFPREVFPISAVAAKFADFLFGLFGLIPLLILYKLPISPMAIMILPLLVIQLTWTTALGLLFSCANLFYRDVRQLIGLLLFLWMYLVPIIYPLEQVPERLQFVYLLNPMAVIIDTARRFAFPQLGGSIAWTNLGIVTVAGFVAFVVAYAVFKHFESRFAESI